MNARMQQRAARVLVALLGEDLPQATWTISEHYSAPRLEGQLGLLSTPAAIKLDRLQMWADHLDAEIVSKRYENQTGGSVSVTSYVDGVRVTVWAAFLKKDLPASIGSRPSVRGGPDIGAEAEDGYRAEQDDPS
ncbi:hypothetical protein [Nonomuraea sp. NPDC023979]|uniref:hypothetical protein n=1 Tax=Nonomuraea sp. NPDC023979 TaxID=3154796 RepID=UPI0033CC84F4